MKHAESHLEQAERHVREGEERIAEQKTLIAELERDGHAAMLPDALRLLANLEDAQRFGTEHLAKERAEAEKGQ